MVKKIISLLCLILFVCSLQAQVDFDGTDDFITVASDVSLDAGATWSVAFWVNVDVDATQVIISRQSTSGWQVFYNAGGNNIIGDGGDGDLTSTSASNSITLDTWHHVVAIWDEGAPSAKIFIDGVESGAEDTVGSLDSGSGNILTIGSKTDGTFFLNGLVQEIAVWSVVLTSAEIELLANAKVRRLPLQIQSSSLQAYWTLDDEEDGSSADGDTFVDFSANSNTGTGDDGANNTGLTAMATDLLSYP